MVSNFSKDDLPEFNPFLSEKKIMELNQRMQAERLADNRVKEEPLPEFNNSDGYTHVGFRNFSGTEVPIYLSQENLERRKRINSPIYKALSSIAGKTPYGWVTSDLERRVMANAVYENLFGLNNPKPPSGLPK